MNSVGNNDRGTLIVPDAVAHSLTKDVNVLWVQYRPDVDSDAVLQKMIPIGLDDTHGYRCDLSILQTDGNGVSE